jgi:hypothetical protein
MSGMPLDLSGADVKGFDPIPAGVYDATVFKAEMQETKGGPEAKMPAGTPRLNVQFRLAAEEGEPFYNRRFFTSYTFPPADYDKAKAAKMQGMFVRFLTAIGYEEKKVMGGKFNLDVEDLAGRECRIVVALKPKYGGAEGEFDNEVKGVKSRNAENTSSIL